MGSHRLISGVGWLVSFGTAFFVVGAVHNLIFMPQRALVWKGFVVLCLISFFLFSAVAIFLKRRDSRRLYHFLIPIMAVFASLAQIGFDEWINYVPSWVVVFTMTSIVFCLALIAVLRPRWGQVVQKFKTVEQERKIGERRTDL